MANVIPFGEPVNDVERDAIRFLRDRLPKAYTIFHNIEFGEPGRATYEYDIIVLGEHAVYAVEVKGFFGRVTGSKRDWQIRDRRRRSPLPLAFQKARVLSGRMRHSRPRIAVWVEAVVFLANPKVEAAFPPEVAEHVYTRETIIKALTDREALHLPHWKIEPAHKHRNEIRQYLSGGRPAPGRTHIGPYRLLGRIGQTEYFVDYEATNEALTDLEGDFNQGSVIHLRTYTTDPYASSEEITRRKERAIWDASVLRWLGQHPGLIRAGDPFFPDDADITVALPFEQEPSITLRTLLEREGPLQPTVLTDRFGPSIQALALAHSRGIVHRRITPDAFVCEPDEPFRLSDFSFSSVADQIDDRVLEQNMEWLDPAFAAPELLDGQPATPASDVFSLGVVLAQSVLGRLPFADVRERTLPATLPELGLLEDLILRMLSPSATERPKDAYAVVEFLHEARVSSPEATIDEHLLKVGDVVNDVYLIERRLGPPRTRTTYLASHQVSQLRRVLRVFEIPNRRLDAVRDAFRNCYELSHPNLVRLNCLDRIRSPKERLDGADLYFIDVEYSQGTPAHRLVAEGGIGAGPAIAIALQICDVLAYLAEKGVHHGGISKHTVMVSENGHVGVVRPPSLLPKEVLTPPIIRYLSRATPSNQSEDVRALANFCWELATGQHPFANAPEFPGPNLSLVAGDRVLAALAGLLKPILHDLDGDLPSPQTFRKELEGVLEV